jgi:Asp-tRNA(Asn)/Glu-tRNA(Gln) amidotransferase A subunit family amidase
MNAPWTALGVPAMTIPMGEADGLPLGLQVVADRGEDLRVLHAAVRVESVMQNPT